MSLLQLGQREQAETELLDLAALNSATAMSVNIEAFCAVLEAHGSPDNLKAAGDLIVQRFPDETYVPTKLVEVILSGEVRTSPCPSDA